MTQATCGGIAHEETCLCDVVVTTPTPINYGLHEVAHADLVIKYMGLGAPWTIDDMAKLLQGLDKAREASDMAKHFQLDPEKLTTYTEPIKQLIAKGHSMVDIPSIVGLSLVDAAKALMSGRTTPIVNWSAADWLAFEADAYEGVGRSELSRRHSIPPMTAKRLADLYLT